MTPSDQSNGSDRPQPGTLLWIGTTSHREVKATFMYCSQTAAQLAVRRSAAEAVRRPAGFVRRILFARPTRHVPKPAIIERLAAIYPDADAIALCGQLCDGEGRTGTVWPVSDRVRFSRWSERLPQWLAPCGGDAKIAAAPEKICSLLILADRFETAQPLLLWADAVGLAAAWHRRFVPALHSRYETILWDDSSAPATSAAQWKNRLPATAPRVKSINHLWMALQPSIEEIEQATRGGINQVLTKPVMIDAMWAAVVSAVAGGLQRG
jgi:hypothetical protein